MEKKTNKKLLIILGCIILAVILAILIFLNINKGSSNNSTTNIDNSNNIQNNEIISEENRKKQELEDKEKQYKENSKYQCFKDDTFKIRFYYNNEELKYGNSIAQGGFKLALQEKIGDGLFSYSTNERNDEYDKNQLIGDFIATQVSSGFTIKENKDITISKITPTETRYVECEKANMIIKNYFIFTDRGIIKFIIGSYIGAESETINGILDTIIIE